MSTLVLESAPPSAGMTREQRKVICASSLGTVFEWYDFYPIAISAISFVVAALLLPETRDRSIDH